MSEDSKIGKARCPKCGNEYNENNECPHCMEINSNKENNNTMSIILAVVGWLILIIGFIGGIALGFIGKNVINYEYGIYSEHVFDYTSMLICWLSCGLFAMLSLALSEIIQLIHDIKVKIRK